MVRFRSTKDLFKSTARMVEHSGMPRPRWLDPFLEVQALPNNTIRTGEEPPGKRYKPPKLSFPEDRFYFAYLQRHPEAKYEPVDLSSSDPPTARRFAWAQLAHLNQGKSTREARKAAEAEFAAEASRRAQVPSVLQMVQQEEETVLTRAMQQHRESPVQQDAWLAEEEQQQAPGSRRSQPPQPDLPYRTAIGAGQAAGFPRAAGQRGPRARPTAREPQSPGGT